MSQKSPFNGSNLTSKSQNIVDQSSRDLFPRTQEESIWKTSHFDLDILSRSGDIRNQSRTLQKIDRNFACFLAPKFNIFRGPTPPNFGPYPAIPLRFRRSAEGPRSFGCLKNLTGKT